MPQGVPGRLRPRIFLTFRHYKGGRSSAKRTGRIYPRRNPWYSLSEAESTSGHMVLSGVPRKKIPNDTTGNRSRDRPASSAANSQYRILIISQNLISKGVTPAACPGLFDSSPPDIPVPCSLPHALIFGCNEESLLVLSSHLSHGRSSHRSFCLKSSICFTLNKPSPFLSLCSRLPLTLLNTSLFKEWG